MKPYTKVEHSKYGLGLYIGKTIRGEAIFEFQYHQKGKNRTDRIPVKHEDLKEVVS